MAESRHHHISSAVITVIRARQQQVAIDLAALDNVEIHGQDNGKIIIVIEGPDTGTLGDTLVAISLLEGVVAANMVFEQILSEEEEKYEQRIFAA